MFATVGRRCLFDLHQIYGKSIVNQTSSVLWKILDMPKPSHSKAVDTSNDDLLPFVSRGT